MKSINCKIMKKYILFTILIIGMPVVADNKISYNPMFGSNKHQIMIHGGKSFRSKDKFENLFFGGITYSQPGSFFFGLPARNNLEINAFKGRDNKENGVPESTQQVDNLSQYDLGMIGISKDVALLSGSNAYLAVGLGVYLKEKKTNRIGSKFTFGERLALGYSFESGIAMEIYARHFSNAGITDDNSGQNFAGLSVGYTF